MPGKTDAGHDHDGDFQRFDAFEDARLVETLAQLACKPGEHHERQDEQAGRDVRQQLRTQRAPAGRLIGHENDQHVLEEIVVEGAAGLRDEERQEAPLAQESELAGFAHDFVNPATLVTHTFRCPVLVYLTTTNRNVVPAARGREGNRNGNEAVH